MENVPMKMLDTPDCSTCKKSDCTEECLSFRYGKSVKVCPRCKNHSIVNNEETYRFCPECGQAIELEHSVRADGERVETNPESITIIDRNGIPHRLFAGYNISEENMERIKEIYGDGK